MISIRVPATTANLGPGFDCLGMALCLYNTIHVDTDTDKLVIDSPNSFGIENSEDNLIYRSMKRLYHEAGKKIPPVKIIQEINIPLSRGLGSSAACITGGLTAANKMLGNIYSKDDLLNIAVEIEGHPDNVAPALLGGFVISAKLTNKVGYVRHEMHEKIKFAALIPDFSLSTSKSRRALPTHINYEDAVFNVGRASLLTASLLTGSFENFRYVFEDRLHEPYRMPLITDSEKIKTAAYEYGADAFFISGSGSTLIAVVKNEDVARTIEHFCSKLENKWEMKLLEADNKGTYITGETRTL